MYLQREALIRRLKGLGDRHQSGPGRFGTVPLPRQGSSLGNHPNLHPPELVEALRSISPDGTVTAQVVAETDILLGGQVENTCYQNSVVQVVGCVLNWLGMGNPNDSGV